MANFVIKSLKVLFAAVTVFYTFYTLVDLTGFLSKISGEFNEDLQNDELWTKKLLVNASLLSLFIFFHSIMALTWTKDMFESWGFKDIQRCFYNIVTCFSLHFLINYWKPVDEFSLWSFPAINSNRMFWWTYILIHSFCWMTIYVGTICMDASEFFGIKQIYYSLQHLPEPLTYKSKELQRLYQHMRHPSFISFFGLFWIYPHMSLDRLFLATVSSLYMYFAWKTDPLDYHYQEVQYNKKFYCNQNY